MAVEAAEPAAVGFDEITEGMREAAGTLRALEGKPIPAIIDPGGTPAIGIMLISYRRREPRETIRLLIDPSDLQRVEPILEPLNKLGRLIAHATDECKAALFPGWCEHYLAGVFESEKLTWAKAWPEAVAIDALFLDQFYGGDLAGVDYYNTSFKEIADLASASAEAAEWWALRLSETHEPLFPSGGQYCCEVQRETECEKERLRKKTPTEILDIIRDNREAMSRSDQPGFRDQSDIDAIWEELYRAGMLPPPRPTLPGLQLADRVDRTDLVAAHWAAFHDALTKAEKVVREHLNADGGTLGKRGESAKGRQERRPTVNEQMLAILTAEQHEVQGYTRKQWAARIKCTESAIQKTAAWRTLQSYRNDLQGERATDRHRRR